DDQGQLRKHVNVFVGNTLIADRIGLSDALTAQDEVYIMQALSGG
ncbi:MAG TPA: molybdenum cofactor biosynthesis protein MoaD, partial [Cytophagales bacterium]|nr:molybdenum cofactor biosynthesis protein MoaD [Cytophagales bacterium]